MRTVVVPAAGLGTRFLPVTKMVPKELLPVVDTPGIELIAQEAAQLGAERLAIVTSPTKHSVEQYFERAEGLEETLKGRGKEEQLRKITRAPELIDAVAVVQEEPLGLGHAVGVAEQVLDDDEDCVGVMLPDDLVLPYGVLEKMAAVRERLGGSVLCAFPVPDEAVSSYGVFAVDDCDEAVSKAAGAEVKKLTGMVEKPALKDAPSRLAAAGRYLLDRDIFDALGRIKPGKGGELQLTDAVELLIDEGHPVHVVVHEGKRHDLGNPAGFIKACVDFGLGDPDYGEHLEEEIQALLDEHRSGRAGRGRP